MEIDKTTIQDLNIFGGEDHRSVFSKINFTTTSQGEAQLKYHLSHPLHSIEAILNVQQILRLILNKEAEWTQRISNGTVMMVERFFETQLNPIPNRPEFFQAQIYRILNSSDFSVIKFSMQHCFDFIRGLKETAALWKECQLPKPLQKNIDNIISLTEKEELSCIVKFGSAKEMSVIETLRLAYFMKYRFKPSMRKLLDIHAELDAWYGMAMAVKNLGLQFPVFENTDHPVLELKGLRHLLLEHPVPYDVKMDERQHFIFLTGANMAGKSTFIKSMGIAVFLAHIGMGVPAESMKLSLFDGLLSNINIMDNITKGESYFYNEVQRIKSTVNKINDGRKWLILIDELFKGTNVEDAMKCSLLVIEGLIKIPHSLFILSTHLYEISQSLQQQSHIMFRYFETTINNEEFSFNYHLKEGVSNDRLGYLILKKEGVVNLLEGL